MLANPKYTEHMIYGRHRTRNGRRTPAPTDQWPWTPAPVHPAIIDWATWQAAQDVTAGHGTSRDGGELNSCYGVICYERRTSITADVG
jgi:hypothetical protein